jgi:crossover junction endodeoxyribonuclease RuvC
MKILGVDPSIRGTGYAVIETDGRQHRALVYGVVKNPASHSQEQCLLSIHDALTSTIQEHQPDFMAMEAVIYVQSLKTAIIMGAARGIALLCAHKHGMQIKEYPAKRIKKASTGFGGAQKNQVGLMVRALLGLRETPASDAADALAVALTHAQSLTMSAVLNSK